MASKPAAVTQLSLIKSVPPLKVSADTKAPPLHYRRLVAWTELPETQRDSTADLYLTPYELRCLATDIRAQLNHSESEHHDLIMADKDAARYLKRIAYLEAENMTLNDKLTSVARTDRILTRLAVVIVLAILLSFVLAALL